MPPSLIRRLGLRSATALVVANIVGAGIKPQSTHPDRAVRERIQVLWLRWTDHADPGGLADFYGLQAMAVRAMVEGGESFARLRVVPDASSIPLARASSSLAPGWLRRSTSSSRRASASFPTVVKVAIRRARNCKLDGLLNILRCPAMLY